MNVIRCENGHFYNSDEFMSCPHCGSASQDSEAPKKNPTVSLNPQSQQRGETTQSGGTVENRHKGGLLGFFKNSDRSKSQSEIIPPRNVPVQNPEEQMSSEKNDISDNEPMREQITSETVSVDEAKGKIYDQDGKESFDNKPFNNVGKESLSAVIDATGVDKDDIKTISYYGNDEEIPVGWLLEVGGGHVGRDYKITDGQNRIGRAPNMDISIDDPKVSREYHAAIIYDPRGKKFYLKPGESKGMTYQNNDIVLDTKELIKGDIVGLGDTNLYFFPLCGEDFSWDNYLGEDE